jgi:pSer/pThr/pTyr-binding forkhead associated (FHA) protein
MKVITIGRLPNNDIVVNDPLVSKNHLQIIQDDFGNFRLADFGSKNGTFVNGKKVSGEVRINPNDIIRIGNTTLQWRNHFPNNNVNNNYPTPNFPSPPPVQPLIPSNINIKRENVDIDLKRRGEKGDDFHVPFRRNLGDRLGNSAGALGGCLLWVVAIVVILGIIALCAKGCA